jgi:hypothetical protein
VAAGEGADSGSTKKTAVVVIHGMGEQWPMDTLRGFVDAAWTTDAEMVPPRMIQTYSKPDAITGSFELRRITTRPWTGDDARRVDFFEFYWAHLMRDNSLGSVLGWLRRLLFRWPSRVPTRLLGGWLVGLVVFVAALVLAALAGLDPELRPFGWPAWAWTAILLAGGALSAAWLRPVAGDAARYLSPAPGNVAARQAIREAGVDLLGKLQATGGYDRIIVAGHSLGTVIGYDMLYYAWGRIDPERLLAGHPENGAAMKALAALEKLVPKLAADKPEAGSLAAWRDAQRAYFSELSKLTDDKGKPLWLVSDFVTLGSPLSKADVLLGRDSKDLELRKARREMPTNPPWLEKQEPPRFSYPTRAMSRAPHHGAVFAPTVWTNIYYPNVVGLVGDFISGQVAPRLGKGVRDVRVPIGFPWFRHLSYWAKPKLGRPGIPALRRALNFRLRDEAALWGGEVDANPVPAERLVPAAKAVGNSEGASGA